MNKCKKCGEELSPGKLKYVVTVNVTADFDGVLPAEGEIEDLEAFMQQIDKEDPVKMERDVFQSLGFILCPECKAKYMENPLGDEDADGGRIH